MQRVGRSLGHSLGARSVHLKLYPSPRSFAERREVLRVLERYGEVDMFKSLKYQQPSYPNAFIAIFETESAAREAINNSPIRYRLITTPEFTPTDPNNTTKTPEETTTFQLECSPSKYPHDAMILKSPLAKGYLPVRPKLSAMASALREVLPETPLRPGLADWETNGIRRRSLINDDLTTEMPWRIYKKRLEERLEERKVVPKSLMESWRLGAEERRRLEAAGVKGVE